MLFAQRVRHPIDGTNTCWVEDTYTVPVAVDRWVVPTAHCIVVMFVVSCSPKDSLTEVHVPLPLIGYLPYKVVTQVPHTPPAAL